MAKRVCTPSWTSVSLSSVANRSTKKDRLYNLRRMNKFPSKGVNAMRRMMDFQQKSNL
jgi:hypothetical protein